MMENLRTARRGTDPEDGRWFSGEPLLKLRRAQEELQWLLDRGYRTGSVIELVGGHYQLSARQRTALQRATSTKECLENRRQKLLDFSMAKEGCIYIDGFNLIITLEVALSQGALILGNDGTLRDLAGLRGTYSVIDKTEKAVEIIGKTLLGLGVPSAKFFLDAPVSNSGRLRGKILEHAESWGFPVEAELVPNPDNILSKLERVVTSDSIILDECKSWFNMSRKIVEDYIEDARIIDFVCYNM
jgi:hypothetical protein